MNFFNGTKYSESAKSAENDYLHLLLCDNGSFTVSHKESGRVFFEMPTLLVGKNDTYSYATFAKVQKCRRGQVAVFDITQEINAPIIGDSSFTSIKEPVVFMNTVILDDRDETLTLSCAVSLPAEFADQGYEAVLRFPFGINEPFVDGTPYDPHLPKGIAPGKQITLSDEIGEEVSLINASDVPVMATVTRDGCVDVFLPSMAPANDFGLIDYSFALSF